jgi:hypothetical protein
MGGLPDFRLAPEHARASFRDISRKGERRKAGERQFQTP